MNHDPVIDWVEETLTCSCGWAPLGWDPPATDQFAAHVREFANPIRREIRRAIADLEQGHRALAKVRLHELVKRLGGMT